MNNSITIQNEIILPIKAFLKNSKRREIKSCLAHVIATLSFDPAVSHIAVTGRYNRNHTKCCKQ